MELLHHSFTVDTLSQVTGILTYTLPADDKDIPNLEFCYGSGGYSYVRLFANGKSQFKIYTMD